MPRTARRELINSPDRARRSHRNRWHGARRELAGGQRPTSNTASGFEGKPGDGRTFGQLSFLVLALLLPLLCSSSASAEELKLQFKPRLFMQAWGSTSRNFTPGSGIFGQSMESGSGNFDSSAEYHEDPTSYNMVESRLRAFIELGVNDRISGMFAVELNSIFGREQGFADYRISNRSSGTGELRIKYFYVDVALSTGEHFVPVKLRVGRQSFETVGSIVVGDPDAEGFTLTGLLPPAWGKIKVGFAFLDLMGTTAVEDYYLHLGYDLPDVLGTFRVGLYGSVLRVEDRTPGGSNARPEIVAGGSTALGKFILGNSGSDRASGGTALLGWVGANASGSFGDFLINADLIFNVGTVAPGRVGGVDKDGAWLSDDRVSSYNDVFGYLFQIFATWDTGANALGAGLAVVSGDDGDSQGGDTVFNGFLDVNGALNFSRWFFFGSPYIQIPRFVSPVVTGSGFIGARITETYRLRDDLSINGLLAALFAHQPRPRLPDATKGITYLSEAPGAGRYYGTELDIWLQYTGIPYTTILLEGDLIFPGDYWKGDDGYSDAGDMAYLVVLGLKVDLK